MFFTTGRPQRSPPERPNNRAPRTALLSRYLVISLSRYLVISNVFSSPKAVLDGTSFDHLVGAGEERRRHGKSQRLGRLQVDA
jgi:hypothetical protein